MDPELIQGFLESEVFAVVGVSPNQEKYGYRVFQDLKSAGYRVYAVNPRYDSIEGETCYGSLGSLPEKPDVVEFVCPPPVTEEMVRELPSLGIAKAWIQPGAESPEAVNYCLENGIDVLHDVCIMVERRKGKRD